jgi:hypothetical protein
MELLLGKILKLNTSWFSAFTGSKKADFPD